MHSMAADTLMCAIDTLMCASMAHIYTDVCLYGTHKSVYTSVSDCLCVAERMVHTQKNIYVHIAVCCRCCSVFQCLALLFSLTQTLTRSLHLSFSFSLPLSLSLSLAFSVSFPLSFFLSLVFSFSPSHSFTLFHQTSTHTYIELK